MMGMAAAEVSEATSNRWAVGGTNHMDDNTVLAAAAVIVVGNYGWGAVLLAQGSSTRNRWHSIAEDLSMLCEARQSSGEKAE